MTMTSSSRDQTEPTPPLLSEKSTVEKALPSKPLASSESTPSSTETTKVPSEPISTTGPAEADNSPTTVPTTPKISEKARQHAVLMRTALLQLEKAGLCKRYRVLSEDGITLKEIQVVFDPSLWTDGLVLSK